jgi:hypothetical protein
MRLLFLVCEGLHVSVWGCHISVWRCRVFFDIAVHCPPLPSMLPPPLPPLSPPVLPPLSVD